MANNNLVMIKRVDALRCMNTIMRDMNNEECYLEWIEEVPDEATDEDFTYIAETKERFDEVFDEFARLIKVYGRDGIYVG